MPRVINQLQAFTLTLVLGVLVGVIFHYYQLFIRNARVGQYTLYLLDFLLWILIILLAFMAMLWINQGEIRFYVLIAMLTGMVIYFRRLSSYLEGILSSIAQANTRGLAVLLHQMRNAFAVIIRLIQRFFSKPVKPPPGEDME